MNVGSVGIQKLYDRCYQKKVDECSHNAMQRPPCLEVGIFKMEIRAEIFDYKIM